MNKFMFILMIKDNILIVFNLLWDRWKWIDVDGWENYFIN